MEKTLEELTTCARGHLRWYGQSAFRIRTDGGKVIVTDPWRMPAAAGPADLILVTHPHGDHYDRKAIAGLSGPATVVVLPSSCAEEGQTAISAGQTLPLGSVSIAGAEAARFMKAALAIPMHYSLFLGGPGAGRRFSRAVGAGSLVLQRFRGNAGAHAYN